MKDSGARGDRPGQVRGAGAVEATAVGAMATTKADVIRATAAIPDAPGAQMVTTLRLGAVFQTAIAGD